MKVIKDIFYTDKKDLSRSPDIYLPECENFPVFVYFHGGGIEGGSKDMGEQIPKDSTHCSYLNKNTPDGKNMFADIAINYYFSISNKTAQNLTGKVTFTPFSAFSAL